MRSLPPLNHLRSFQIIGKHLNLVRASNEVNLTASALSHQLNVLENQLGIKLFTRTGRGLAFTKAGKELHVEVEVCLARLEKAVRSVTVVEKDSVLVVNALPTFAMRWLLPRFAGFAQHNTSVEIRVSTLSIDFERDNVDCAIYYGHPGREGLDYEFLRDVSLIVVCSPSAITDAKPLAKPADLSHHQLLRAKMQPQAKMPDDWSSWFESAAVPRPQNLRQLVLENRNLVIQAAQSGLGVAVVDPLMVQDELESGRLIQPLQHVARASGSYFLVYPSTAKPAEKVIAFRDWLVGEMHGEGACQPLRYHCPSGL